MLPRPTYNNCVPSSALLHHAGVWVGTRGTSVCTKRARRTGRCWCWCKGRGVDSHCASACKHDIMGLPLPLPLSSMTLNNAELHSLFKCCMI